MFPAPPVVQAQPFARLPQGLRRAGPCPWGEVNNGRRPTDCFLEGPAFDRRGSLYLADIPYGRIFRVDAAGRFEVVTEYDGEPNGLQVHRDGRVFIADYRRGVLVLDPATGRIDEVIGRRHTESFKGVNDLTFASNGDLYFTDQGQTGLHDPTGRVYRYTAAGRLECLADTLPSPNGLCLDGAEANLLVSVTRGNAIWRLPLREDGSVSKVGLFIQLSGGIGPDGLAMDEEDGLAVAHAGMGGAWIFDRRGVPTLFVAATTGDFTTNLAFGGEDRRDLYLVESGSGTLLRARLPVAGRRLFSHMDPGDTSHDPLRIPR